jgi:Zn finger protein HypA/HybF involved in hydrogenase expression
MTKKDHQHVMGGGGECICSKCATRIAHRRSVPCQDEACPECGTKMLRVGSEHYRLWLKKKSKTSLKT